MNKMIESDELIISYLIESSPCAIGFAKCLIYISGVNPHLRLPSSYHYPYFWRGGNGGSKKLREVRKHAPNHTAGQGRGGA